MDEQFERSTEQRLADLEERLAHLQYTVERLAHTIEHRQGAIPPRREPRARPPAAPAPDHARTRETDASTAPTDATHQKARPYTAAATGEFGPRFDTSALIERGSEFWLSRVGIGLVLFGVVFLFKYAVDQGWLTPELRLTLGAALGATLYGLGAKLHFEKPWFSRILLGGGIGAFYVTAYAATQLYGLVSYNVGFGIMGGITVLAFYSALGQNQPVLSVIGALGGLSTPFLLTTDSGTALGFATYVSAILVGTAAIFRVRGWSALLWVSVIGGWAALGSGSDVAGLFGGAAAAADRWAFQGAAVVLWLSYWAATVLRELDLSQETAPEEAPILPRSLNELRGAEAHILAVGLPVLALWFSSDIWTLADEWWGVIAFGAAAWYALAGTALRRSGRAQLGLSHFASATVLFTIALALLLEGDWLIVAWAAEATALHYVGTHAHQRLAIKSGHVLFAIVLIWLAVRMGLFGPTQSGTPIFNAAAATDLAVIGLIIGTSVILGVPHGRRGYLLLAHAALLAWLLRELAPLPNGNGFVTVAWGLYAVVLLVAGLTRGVAPIRTAGLATLLLVVGKLFFVDLANVGGIWRIMLFLGFGLAFLTLSYFFRSLWKPDTSAGGDGPSRNPGD